MLLYLHCFFLDINEIKLKANNGFSLSLQLPLGCLKPFQDTKFCKQKSDFNVKVKHFTSNFPKTKLSEYLS